MTKILLAIEEAEASEPRCEEEFNGMRCARLENHIGPCYARDEGGVIRSWPKNTLQFMWTHS